MAQSGVALPAQPRAAAGGKWAIAIAVALGALLEVVDTSIVNVALTDIQNTLGATLSEVSWVVSGYAVANVIVLPLTAWLGDRFGKKRYFIFSLIGFTVASIMCGLATTLPMLVIARVLQGLMGGGLLAKAQAILFETFPKEEQALRRAFFGAIVIAGPAIGPTLGGYLVTNIGWRWIFFVNVPLGIFAVLMCQASLKPDTDAKNTSQIDWIAILLLATGLGCLQTFLEEGNSEDWFESRMISVLFVTAIVSIVAFVHRQLKSKAPVVDLSRIALPLALGRQYFECDRGHGAVRHAVRRAHLCPITVALHVARDGHAALAERARVCRNHDRRGPNHPQDRLAAGFDHGRVDLVFAVHQLSNLTSQTGADDFFWPLIIRSVGTVACSCR